MTKACRLVGGRPPSTHSDDGMTRERLEGLCEVKYRASSDSVGVDDGYTVESRGRLLFGMGERSDRCSLFD